ncbi:MAG: hypothetical protein HYV03_00290, partial [Deltaproteobacteria bacterium]|nr:hypothetical protein [Deltaproteobacteria bacterium]
MVPPTNVAPFPDLVELVFGRATARMVNGVELKGAPNPEGSTNTFGLVSGTLAAPKLAPIGTLPAGPFRPVLVPGAQPAAPFSPPSPTAGLYIILGGLLLAVVPQLLIGDGPAPNEDLLTYWMRHQQPAGDPIPQRTEAEERAAQLQLLEEEAARLQRNGEEDLARAAEQTLHGLRQRMAGSTANPSASQSHTSAHPTIVASAEGKTPPKGTRGPEGTQTEEAPEGAAPRHRFPLQVGDAREIFPWMELARLPGFNGAVIFRWQDERGLLMPMRPSSLGDKRHIYQILSDAGITITTAPQGTYGVRVGQTKETVRLQRGSIDVGLTEPNNDYAIQEGDRLLVGPTEFIFHPPTPKARLGELDHPPLPWKEWVAYFSGTPVAPEINSKTADPQYRFDPLHLPNKLLNEYAAAGRLGEEEARQVLARLYAYLRYEALGGRLQDSVAGAAEELLTLKGLRPTYSYGTILDSMRVEASPAHGDSASDVAGPVARAPAEPGRLSVSEGLRWHLERFFPKGGQSVAAIGETLTNMEQTLALDRPEPTHPSPNGTRPGSGLRAAYAEYKQIDPNRTRILGDESARVWTDRLIEELSRRGLERAILPRAGWLWVGNYP